MSPRWRPTGWRGRWPDPGGDRVPATVGRPAQGIADGADGHAVRIEADRGGADYLRRYAPLGASRRQRGHGGAVLDRRERAAERGGLRAVAKK